MVDKPALFGRPCSTIPLPNNSNQFTCQYTSSSQEELVNGKYASTHLTLNGSSLAPSAPASPAAVAAALAWPNLRNDMLETKLQVRANSPRFLGCILHLQRIPLLIERGFGSWTLIRASAYPRPPPSLK